MLADGNVFVGWGQLPYFSEYTASGKLLYLGSLHAPDESYRTYRDPWVGLPLTKPSIALAKASSGSFARARGKLERGHDGRLLAAAHRCKRDRA